MIVNIVPNLASADKITYVCDFSCIQDAVDHFAIKDPHIVLCNNLPVLKRDWDEFEEEISIVIVPGEIATVVLVTSIVSALVSMASLAYAIYKSQNIPSIAAMANLSLPSAKDVFSFAGQVNAKKLNEPIEICYGNCRWYPPFFSLPKISFDSSDRTKMSIFLSLGVSDVTVSDVKIGESLVDLIPGCSWKFHAKGSALTSAEPSVVFISDKVNVKLAADNEDTFEKIRTILNPPGSKITSFQINIGSLSGLYALSGGNIATTSVTVNVRFRAIDNVGNPLTDWLVNPGYGTTMVITLSAGTVENKRRSVDFAFPSAWTNQYSRYEIEVWKDTDTFTSSQGVNVVTLISAYGCDTLSEVLPVNVLEVSLTGSNSIAEDSATKINCVTDRKLRHFDSTGTDLGVWSDRSSIWAIVDCLTADYGAKIPVSELDHAYWVNLAETVDSKFDNVFTSKSTIWDVMKIIAANFKAEPVIVGSDVRLAIDSVESLPVTLFTPDNAFDMSWSTSFPERLDSNCVEVVYTDHSTGLKSSVQFTPPGSDGSNPETLTMIGESDRDSAWRYGAYIYQGKYAVSDSVKFSTGMEGMIPLVGDVISLSWSFPEWSQAGIVVDKVGTTLIMSDDVTEGDWIALRKNDGSVYGPVKCTLGVNPNEVVLTTDVPVGMFDFNFGQVMYSIGTSETINRMFRVKSLSQIDNGISIEAVEHNTTKFLYDGFNAPVNDREPFSGLTDYVPWITVRSDSDSFYKVLFPLIANCNNYIVRYAYDPTPIDGTETELELYPQNNAYASTSVDVFNNVAYVPKQVGKLFISVDAIAGSTIHTTYWRSYSGDPLAMRIEGLPNSIINDNLNTAHVCSMTTPTNLTVPNTLSKLEGVVAFDLVTPFIMRAEDGVATSLQTRVSDFGKGSFSKTQLIAAGLYGKPIHLSCHSLSILVSQDATALKPVTSEVSSSLVKGPTLSSDYWERFFWGDNPILKSITVATTCADIDPAKYRYYVTGESVLGNGSGASKATDSDYPQFNIEKLRCPVGMLPYKTDLGNYILLEAVSPNLITPAEASLMVVNNVLIPCFILKEDGADIISETDGRMYCLATYGATPDKFELWKCYSVDNTTYSGVNGTSKVALDAGEKNRILTTDNLRVVIAGPRYYAGSDSTISVKASMLPMFSPNSTQLSDPITIS